MTAVDGGEVDDGLDPAERGALEELVAGCLEAVDEEIAAVREELTRRGLR